MKLKNLLSIQSLIFIKLSSIVILFATNTRVYASSTNLVATNPHIITENSHNKAEILLYESLLKAVKHLIATNKQKQIRDLLKQDDFEIDIEPSQLTPILSFLASNNCFKKYQLELSQSSYKKYYPNSFVVNLNCTPVTTQISVTDQFAVAINFSKLFIALRSDLPSNHLLKNSDLIKIRQNFNLSFDNSNSGPKINYFESPKQLANLALKQALQAETVLESKHVYQPILVQKGKQVQVIWESASKQVQINSRGLALNSGRINEVIDVKNSSSKKTFQALVIGKNKVALMQ